MKRNLQNTFLLLTFFLALFCFSGKSVAQWVQRGADLNGEASFNYSGRSIGLSADGSIVAIGAPGNDGTGTASGHARVYQWNGSAWIQLGNDIDGEAPLDNSGNSVSLDASGQMLAIGAMGNSDNGADAGHVRVYQWSGSSWTQIGADIDGEAAGDWLGSSVSMSDDGITVACGAFQNAGNGAAAGHVRVYQLSGGSWIQKGADIDGEAAGDWSGASVSLNANGNLVAIGAYKNGGGTITAGHTRIYEWNGSAWMQKGQDIDGLTGDWAGFDVSLNDVGNQLIIGSPANSDSALYAGVSRIYQWNGSAWLQKGSTLRGSAIQEHEYGWSVSMNAYGDTIAVGAHNGGWGVGYTYVYGWNGNDWNLLGNVIDPASTAGNQVCLNQAGDIVAIGSDLDNGGGLASGHSRVYADMTTGISENNFPQELIAYPNPTNGWIYFSLGSSYPDVEITIRNVLGQVVAINRYDMIESAQVFLNGPQGIYFAEIISGNRKTVLKVCKQ